MAEARLYEKIAAEFIGTFFLMVIIGLCVGETSADVKILTPLAIGCALTVLVYSLGTVSGAHLNPAVSLAIWVTQRCEFGPKDLAAYSFAQLSGGACAGLVFSSLHKANHFTLDPMDSAGVAIALEVMMTTFLIFVILNVATTKHDPAMAANPFFGAAIGCCIPAAAVASGGLNQCCLNPAVAVGALLAELHNHHVMEDKPASRHLTNYLIFSFAPLVGSIIASICFFAVRGSVEYANHPLVLGAFTDDDEIVGLTHDLDHLRTKAANRTDGRYA